MKKFRTRWPALICSLFILFGCASDQAHRYYVKEKYSPKSITLVQLLVEAPKRSFVVIADFQSRGESPEDMRRRAAEIGADAVIVTVLGGQVLTSAEWAGKGSVNNYTRITGTAIIFN